MKEVYKVLENFAANALIDKDEYIKMYNESVNDSEGFWKKHAKRINWIKSFSKVKNVSFDKNNLFIKWFEDGTLNVSANCIDRHLKNNSDKIALLWQGDNDGDVKKIRLLSFGLVMILKTVKKFLTNNYIKKYQKLQMD